MPVETMTGNTVSETRNWSTRRVEKERRMHLVSRWMTGPVLRQERIVEALESQIAPAERIVIEGENRKQADFLAFPVHRDSRLVPNGGGSGGFLDGFFVEVRCAEHVEVRLRDNRRRSQRPLLRQLRVRLVLRYRIERRAKIR